MRKQNLARNFRDHGPQEVNGFQLSSLDLMERKRQSQLTQFPVPLSTWDEYPFQQCEASRGMHVEH